MVTFFLCVTRILGTAVASLTAYQSQSRMQMVHPRRKVPRAGRWRRERWVTNAPGTGRDYPFSNSTADIPRVTFHAQTSVQA